MDTPLVTAGNPALDQKQKRTQMGPFYYNVVELELIFQEACALHYVVYLLQRGQK